VAKTYNLFISHSWAYPNAYNNLVNLLDNRGYFPYKNHSIPIHDPIHTNGILPTVSGLTKKFRLPTKDLPILNLSSASDQEVIKLYQP